VKLISPAPCISSQQNGFTALNGFAVLNGLPFCRIAIIWLVSTPEMGGLRINTLIEQ
jgi:hypothetical protein